jgi:hypothetical protein
MTRHKQPHNPQLTIEKKVNFGDVRDAQTDVLYGIP